MNKKTLTAMNILFVLSFVAGAVCVAYRRNWLLFGNVVFGLVLIESLYLFVWRKGHPLPTVEEQFIDFVKLSTEKKAQF